MTFSITCTSNISARRAKQVLSATTAASCTSVFATAMINNYNDRQPSYLAYIFLASLAVMFGSVAALAVLVQRGNKSDPQRVPPNTPVTGSVTPAEGCLVAEIHPLLPRVPNVTPIRRTSSTDVEEATSGRYAPTPRIAAGEVRLPIHRVESKEILIGYPKVPRN